SIGRVTVSARSSCAEPSEEGAAEANLTGPRLAATRAPRVPAVRLRHVECAARVPHRFAIHARAVPSGPSGPAHRAAVRSGPGTKGGDWFVSTGTVKWFNPEKGFGFITQD